MSRLAGGLQGDAGALLREARAAVEELRRDLAAARGGAGGAGGGQGGGAATLAPRLAALEGKLGVLEGALLGAGERRRPQVLRWRALLSLHPSSAVACVCDRGRLHALQNVACSLRRCAASGLCCLRCCRCPWPGPLTHATPAPARTPGPPAARDSREAAAAAGALPERLSRDGRAAQEALLAAVKGELRLAVSALASEESAAIARLDARLAVGGARRAAGREGRRGRALTGLCEPRATRAAGSAATRARLWSAIAGAPAARRPCPPSRPARTLRPAPFTSRAPPARRWRAPWPAWRWRRARACGGWA